MLQAIAVLAAVAAVLSALAILGERRFGRDNDSPIDRIERLLPRIQCGQCGFPGCRPYAQALVGGTAAVNLCPPGGPETVQELAAALGRAVEPLRTDLGSATLDNVAWIDEARCIGCGLCRPVCPVDAIIGIPQTMHTIIGDRCTGCELCVAPCPVDCISLRRRP